MKAIQESTYVQAVEVKKIVEGSYISSIKFEYNEVRLELSNGHELLVNVSKDSGDMSILSINVLKKVLTRVAGVRLD